jgi:UDP-N-acetylglucosamine 2-epimerase (non-hydrolysing)
MADEKVKVLCIFGTRPEVIKMAPIVAELKRRPEQFITRTCATAQHRDMLDQAVQIWQLEPDIDLDIMEAGQTPSEVAARVLLRLEPVLQQEKPDWILVQGDTTTVMASAITAHHLRIKIGHVEAGLRTHDKWNPFPEEMNRVMADHLSDLCFAPTQRAKEALLKEGIAAEKIVVTGNTVVDALLQVSQRQWQPEADSILAKLPADKNLILVTAHRRESFGEPMAAICEALKQIARRNDVHIVFPVHLNPNVRHIVFTALREIPAISLLDPVDYQQLVYLMKRSRLILTDSGGIQEEAPTLAKPVLVMREVTERPEAVTAGVARLVGTKTRQIVTTVNELLDDENAYVIMATGATPYGDGHAAHRIANSLTRFLG